MFSTSWKRSMIEKEKDDDKSDLFVFGYSSKLFKDDIKARFIDEGKHLIPWMGDKSLLIDRFDVRGYLQDVKKYESKANSLDVNDFSPVEIEIEKLCDDERFKDLQAEQDLHEEEIKRLRAAVAVDGAYHEIGFNYDAQNENESEKALKEVKKECKDEAYTPPETLALSDDIEVPSTMKLHNLIAKTAAFISKHGPQMEILIKTKQSSNSQFDFLSFDSPLNSYYKHLVAMIKSGQYKFEDDGKEQESEDSEDEPYLHPSLLGNSKQNTSPNRLSIPILPSTNDENNAYSQLVKSLKDKIIIETEPLINSESSSNHSQVKNVSHLPSQLSHLSHYNLEPPNLKKSSLLPSPPPDVELIIEKLAQYVAKNGEEFEQTVRKRDEERFEFLNPGNIYHAHYIRRKLYFLEEKRKLQANELIAKKSNETENEKNASKSSVSFTLAIKDKKKLIISDNNDDGDIDDDDTRHDNNNSDDNNEMTCDKDDITSELNLDESKKSNCFKSSVNKEKQLQEERKKKAALFVRMLKAKKAKADDNGQLVVNTQGDEESVESKSLNQMSPTIARITTPSPKSDTHNLIDDSYFQKHLLTADPIRTTSLLPFISNDKPILEKSIKASNMKETFHEHRHHRHSHHHSHRHSHRHSQRHRSRSSHQRSSKSESRSLNRSCSRSRSRSRSRTRRKKRSHRRSRTRSRTRSKSRSKSHSRNKSSKRSKSRSRSKSKSRYYKS